MTLVLWSFNKSKYFSLMAVARWCHVAAPHHHVDHVDLGQHDDNVAFVYLLRLHPLLSHLLRAKLNESKPSWGTYPTMVAELISGNVGCMRARTENLTNFKFPDHPSWRRVYFNLTIKAPGSPSSPAGRVEKYFSWFYLFWFPVLYRGKKRCHDS